MLERLRNLRKKLKNQKGLTLIELLAVILILGILAAIVIPVITGQGEGARITSHEGNINSIESSAERYDLERELKNEDFTVLTDNHPIILEGYLEEVPQNPWKGTNSSQESFVYVLTKDARGVVHAYLADSNFENIVEVSEDGEAAVVPISSIGLIKVGSNAKGLPDFDNDYNSSNYLNQRYFHQ